ncbi:MAG: aspartyl-tRNA amidotransferase [candidate division Zixibacteria bacterium RBG_16_50_21]|nr:MAG: aspartyl-tRNA amidotransferase [candidate division Zixibacteria bacterium RBG_16_50_21]
MSIAEKIGEDLKEAQKQRDQTRLSTLRMLKSELKYKEIEKGKPLTEEEEIGVLSSSAKKRMDSIIQFRKGNRSDLVTKEESELKVVQNYLPEQLSESDLRQIIDQAVSEVGALGKSDLGKVMKVLMPKVKGRADGKLVNQLVTSRLEQAGAS